MRCPSDSDIIIVDLSSNIFNYRKFSTGDFLLNTVKDHNYLSLIAVGFKSGKGYIYKFYPQSLSMHPDFTTTTLTMNVYTSGSYNIIPESGITITSPSSTATVTFSSLTNGTFVYHLSSADSLNLQISTSSQSYLSLLENSYIEIMPSLTCSSLSSTTITYSISNYNGVTAPKWVIIDSTSGLLKISTPNITNSLSVSFYVNSQISGIASTYQKVIYLKVGG